MASTSQNSAGDESIEMVGEPSEVKTRNTKQRSKMAPHDKQILDTYPQRTYTGTSVMCVIYGIYSTANPFLFSS